MVRSSMLVPLATIGAVRLAAPIRATSTSIAAMPIWTPFTEQTAPLFVALRIKKVNIMEKIKNKLKEKDFVNSLFNELSKLPFGSLPKSELELVIFHSMIDAFGGYEELNKNRLLFQRELKISKTKFNNKVLEAQLRYEKPAEPEKIFNDYIFKKSVSELRFEGKYLSFYISDPLKRDILKTFIDSLQILNDTSFNQNIIKIHSKDFLIIVAKSMGDNKAKKIEQAIKTECNLKPNASFSLVGNMNIESVFSASLVKNPLRSAENLFGILKKVLK